MLFQVEEILLGASRELDSLCDPAFWEAGVDRPLVMCFVFHKYKYKYKYETFWEAGADRRPLVICFHILGDRG